LRNDEGLRGEELRRFTGSAGTNNGQDLRWMGSERDIAEDVCGRSCGAGLEEEDQWCNRINGPGG